jgi:hypothetical protein
MLKVSAQKKSRGFFAARFLFCLPLFSGFIEKRSGTEAFSPEAVDLYGV